MKYSLTIAGVLIAFAGTILMQWFSESCTNEIVKNIPLIIGSLMAYIGRIRQGDVNMFGVKK